MFGKQISIASTSLIALFGLVMLLTATRLTAQTERTLHTFFENGVDGGVPEAGLTADSSGNFYGATVKGGAHNYGTVYELMPKTGGGWTEVILHSFNFDGTDGFNPYANVTLDGAGNVYGIGGGGGTFDGGIVFELIPQTGGGWTEEILYNFGATGTDAFGPEAGVIFDGAGNLYGTTAGGGAFSAGAVFELMQQTGGGWAEVILHSFNTSGGDGSSPQAGLVFDASGNLYGTTTQGGTSGNGTVFELTPGTGGVWTETVLYSFNGTDGMTPLGNLIFDGSGNIYGTTSIGGAHTKGTVYELMPQSGGTWTEKILHNFNENGVDGYLPFSGVTFNASGHLFGTTNGGGSHSDGTVYELAPTAGGEWGERVYYSFEGSEGGAGPYASVIFDASGIMYGTAVAGGAHNQGVVFGIAP